MDAQTYGIDNSNVRRGIPIPAFNASAIGAYGGRLSQVAPQPESTQPGALLGRPLWTYVRTQAGPVRGPQPRLAKGSGRTGNPSLPGNAAQLPGYLSDNQYEPTTSSYDPVHQPTFQTSLPRSIPAGNNGREMVGTYQPHDFTPGTRFFGQWRQAANWQVMEYPPDFRNLLAWQQVQKYRVQSFTVSPRPLDSSNYFVGYQINPQIAATMGQGTLGYMGSQ